MHIIKKVNNDNIAPWSLNLGSVEQRPHCQEFKTFDEAICQAITGLSDVRGKCPATSSLEEKILIFRYCQ